MVAESSQEPVVSVVLAAHDEARTVGEVVAGLREQAPQGSEIIVVDDGSTDETASRAAAAGARVIGLPSNRGKGEAMRAGIEAARGEVLVFLDADGQDDPADLPALLAALREGVTMVIGSRFLGRFEAGAITGVNRWGNRALTAVINRLYGARLTDTQAGYRCVRAEALRALELRARRYDFETDVLLGILGQGGRVLEVPVHRRAREHGRTGLSTVRDGLRIAGRIAAHRFKLS